MAILEKVVKGIKSLCANLLILVGALALCVLVSELSVRLFVKEYPTWKLYNVDKENRLQFVPGSKSHYETAEYVYDINANSFGRRGAEWESSQIQNSSNVIFIGDSFVLGYGVQIENAITSLLERALKEHGKGDTVFNFGMPGGVSLPEYKELLKRALDIGITAETVLVGIFVGNDFSLTTVAEKAQTTDQRANLDSAEKTAAAAKIKIHFKSFDYLRQRISGSPLAVGLALKIGQLVGKQFYDTGSSYIFLKEQSEEQQAGFAKILSVAEEIQDLCKTNGRNFKIVIFPNKIQVENFESLTTTIYEASKPQRLITRYCGEHHIDCLDLLPVLRDHFDKEGRSLFFATDRHLNKEGNAVAAEAIAHFAIK